MYPNTTRALLLLVAVLLLWFGPLDMRGLFAPDEGRYGLIPLEMLKSGDWVVPHLNGLAYFEKPPLQYWLTALLFRLIGEQEWAVRAWPALSGLLTACSTALYCAMAGRPRQGVVAACLLLSSILTFLFSQVATLDMGLTLFLTVAMLLYLDILLRPAPARRWRAVVAWVALALAVLSKGLVALALPVIALLLYMAVMRDLAPLKRARLAWGVPLLALIALPWFLLAQRAQPQFFEFFIVHEHFDRYTTAVHHRAGAWWYFAAVLVLGMLPWTHHAVAAGAGAAVRLFRRTAGVGHASSATLSTSLEPGESNFLVLWAMVVLVFFSLSDSKLPAYILPAFPMLAILAAERITTAGRIRLIAGLWPLLAIVPAIAVGALVLVQRGFDDVEAGTAQAFLPWAEAAAVVLAAGGLSAAWLWHRRRCVAGAAMLALLALAGWQLLLTGATAFESSYSARGFAQEVIARLGPHANDGPWYSVGTYDNSFGFYTRHPMRLVAYQDELAFGLSIEPDAGVPLLSTFIERWRASQQAFAFMQPATYDALATSGLPMQLLARDRRRIFVARVPILSGSAP